MKNLIVVLVLSLSLSAFAKPHVHHYKTKKYEKKHGLGLKRHVERHRAFKELLKSKSHTRGALRDLPIPQTLNLAERVSPPEDQGQHGTCWDFGVIKALRSAHMLVGKDPGRLSFNWLICDGHTQYSCDSGGDMDSMQTCLNGKGPWLAEHDPYPNCSGRCVKGLPVAATAKDIVVVGDGTNRPSFKDIAQAIAQEHMLVIDVAVCGEWGSYSEGIFDHNQCGPRSINHIINLVGFHCQTSVDANGKCLFNAKGQPVNGDGYLIVMNNWGNDWGEQGYMRTRWGIDAVADTAMYFEVDHPVPPTPPPVPPTPVPPQPPVPPKNPLSAAWIIVAALMAAATSFLVYKALAKSTPQLVEKT